MTQAPAEAEGWHRLHPLSPLIQAGRLVAGLFTVLAVTFAQGGHGGYRARIPDLILVVVLAVAALVRWLVTRWRLDGSTLRIETGLFRRDSQQLPVTRIQAIDVVRPFLARVLGLAELRIRLAGSSTKADGRLAYLTEQQAASVRAMLLAVHQPPAPAQQQEPQERQEQEERQEQLEVPISQVPAGPLIGSSILLAATQFIALGVVLAIIATIAPRILVGLLGTLGLYAFGLATAAWRRVSSRFGFTVTLSAERGGPREPGQLTEPEGLRITRGLLGTVAETVPVRRIQAVRMVQPVLWRPFGWCRLQVDVAGAGGRDEGSRESRKELLPVGAVAEAEYLAQLVLRHRAPQLSKPPARATVKAPLSYHFLAAGHDEVMAVTTTGRLVKTTVWLRLEKAQSIRLVQDPVQRALNLADVHVDAAGKKVHAIFRDRPASQARELLDELAILSRTARNVSGLVQYGRMKDMEQSPYLDREESWLRFNQRVLELAEDETVPLLDRVRFLAIFANNLDEFFMVRVAGLMRRMVAGFPVEGNGVRLPGQVLENTLQLSGELTVRHARTFSETVRSQLAEAGIEILRWKELSDSERDGLAQLFRQRIYPVLTPLVVDPAHPFPFISGLSLNLAVMIADPRTDLTMFARVKVPPLLPRFLAVSQYRFVPIEDVIAAHLGDLFGGLEVIEHHVFRVTRIRDLEVDEDITENLLQAMERELVRRRFEPAVRLEVEESISDDVLDRLVTELDVDARAVYRLPSPLDLAGLTSIADLNIGELRYPAFVPSTRALPQKSSIFTAIAEHDILLQHPYDSFSASVERLIEEAADDPRVLAIKQTLYRTSGQSAIVDALIDAAEAGKQVVVVVEIKARFDERANITWARKLEQSGCHVVYGFVGLKTHCKMALIVREETDGTLRRYCHLGTGNYHSTTARFYEDFGLLTADPAVGEDVTALFNHLTGYARTRSYERLLVAPEALRNGIVQRIDEQAALGPAGRVQFKSNALVDEVVIDALYRASQAGVQVDLWIRGICGLRPGVAGMSENIRVRSILGRFLEHSRIYAFGTAEAGEVWIGSADMMHRNLDRRVEMLVRVSDTGHQRRVRGLLEEGMDDEVSSWWLDGEGTWTRHLGLDIQETLVKECRARPDD